MEKLFLEKDFEIQTKIPEDLAPFIVKWFAPQLFQERDSCYIPSGATSPSSSRQ